MSTGKPGEYDPTVTPTSDATQADSFDPSERPSSGIPGYQLRDVIGRGGMGEVILAHDPRMERDVAVKRMLAERPTVEAEARFLREAKIQARLDHPAIVPVYELGRDATGRPFFAMKRLSGTTLAALLETGESTQRLLRAVVDVCLAIALAHERQIVHRDLKPSNIMLGDYGEVYVLDWGIARILDDRSSLMTIQTSPSVDRTGTQTGQMLGTPGYMAPEQMAGSDVGTAADIYALGAIVFEILAGEPLHPRGAGAIGSTLGHVQTSPAERRPDRTIPLELDRVCREALRGEPGGRPSARQLADGIQRYLDGDRDTERRRALALEDLTVARAAREAGDRAKTMKHAGRAMTLDPSCTEAVELATSLLLEPPEKLPPELETRIAKQEEAETRLRSKRAIVPFFAFFLLVPMLPLISVRSWGELGVVAIAMGVQIAVSYINWRVRKMPLAVMMLSQFLLVLAFSRIASGFILTPVLAAGMALSVASIPWLNDRPLALASWAFLMMLAPFGLELLGLVEPSWRLQDGLLIQSTIFERTTMIDIGGLILGNATIVMVIAAYTRMIARDRRVAQRALYAHTWHLEQLIPRSKAGAVS